MERPQVTQEVAAAAAQGDRSENAEYIYGKRRLREIDRRIRYLTKRLDSLIVATASPEQQGRVFFGAWVTVEDDDGKLQTWRIVGSDEFDIRQGMISVESPIAKALLGKSEGDTVVVHRPKGECELTIVGIRYEDWWVSSYLLLFFAALLAGAINSVAGGGTLLTFPALLSAGLHPSPPMPPAPLHSCPDRLAHSGATAPRWTRHIGTSFGSESPAYRRQAAGAVFRPGPGMRSSACSCLGSFSLRNHPVCHPGARSTLDGSTQIFAWSRNPRLRTGILQGSWCFSSSLLCMAGSLARGLAF